MHPHLLLLIHAAATWYMVGLIWMVQIVHYPMFNRVGEEQFAPYVQEHGQRITPIVMLPMVIELGTALLLLSAVPAEIPKSWLYLGAGLVLAIWVSTALLQVPCHGKLSEGYHESAYRWLVLTNWIRTLLWTVRGVLTSLCLWRVMQ